MFHFVEAGNGAAFGRSSFINFFFGMAIELQQSFRRAFHRLRGNEVSGTRVKSDFNSALRYRANEAQGISNSASAQHRGGVHQLLVYAQRNSQLIEKVGYIIYLIVCGAAMTKAGDRFANGDGRIWHGAKNGSSFGEQGREFFQRYARHHADEDMPFRVE